jgi:peptidylprolyl isomerase
MPIAVTCIALGLAGCGGSSSSGIRSSSGTVPTAATHEKATNREALSELKAIPPQDPPPRHLVKKDLIKGTGRVAKFGDKVTVEYVGVDYETGEQFESSSELNEPFTFKIGSRDLISGWERDMPGMRVGGRRELIIPPNLAFGSERHGRVAPNSTLIFVVDLVDIK